MVHRAGLNADILTDGRSRSATEVVAVDDGRVGQGRLRSGRAGHPRPRRDDRQDAARRAPRPPARARSSSSFPRRSFPFTRRRRWAREFAGWDDGDAKQSSRGSRGSRWTVRARRRADRRDRAASTASGSRSASTSSTRGTIYNSLLFYAPDGELALHHRKLMPTNHERLVWGHGDGDGLDRSTRGSAASAASSAGRTSCRSRASRSTSAASRSTSRRPRTTASRGTTRSATSRARRRAFVVSVLRLPARVELPRRRSDRRRAATCSAAAARAIVGPDGEYLAGPLWDEEGILYAELDPRAAATRSGSASTPPATTAGPTCSASKCASRFRARRRSPSRRPCA